MKTVAVEYHMEFNVKKQRKKETVDISHITPALNS